MNESQAMQSEDDVFNRQPSAKAFFAWLLSIVVGSIFALILTAIVIPAIYGVEYRSSSSVWMLSGVTDLVFGVFCLPVFVVAHAVTYLLVRSRGQAMFRSASIATAIGLVAFLPVVVGMWHAQGAQKVLRAR